MKTNKLPAMTIAAFILVVGLSSCGRTNRGATATDSSVSGVNVPVVPTPTFTSTSTSTSTNTNIALDPPLSFEFTLNAGQAAITPPFQTDNVLKVKFIPGATQGNSFHSASELAVTLSTNGTEFTPSYTSNNYVYGMVGETSNVIDISSYIAPGSNTQITIKNPKSNFYCTYAPNPFYYWDGYQYAPTNPLFNNYPGCRRDIHSSHKWSGKLIVQTSSTQAI